MKKSLIGLIILIALSARPAAKALPVFSAFIFTCVGAVICCDSFA